eukprot:CAMPEP_0194447454 /NCGR_PEP_ID=MMETSP0176-20130528/129019_1 /TAXON_ID=216777 /ORGANISM="Proboscia alata, Strain PI-D3" /LENGTH=944 /DNA_ID=CAMNT_0039274313 /DNA_START=55 /DNA_END=2887 /DNA_ORIENTATION=+
MTGYETDAAIVSSPLTPMSGMSGSTANATPSGRAGAAPNRGGGLFRMLSFSSAHSKMTVNTKKNNIIVDDEASFITARGWGQEIINDEDEEDDSTDDTDEDNEDGEKEDLQVTPQKSNHEKFVSSTQTNTTGILNKSTDDLNYSMNDSFESGGGDTHTTSVQWWETRDNSDDSNDEHVNEPLNTNSTEPRQTTQQQKEATKPLPKIKSVNEMIRLNSSEFDEPLSVTSFDDTASSSQYSEQQLKKSEAMVFNLQKKCSSVFELDEDEDNHSSSDEQLSLDNIMAAKNSAASALQQQKQKHQLFAQSLEALDAAAAAQNDGGMLPQQNLEYDAKSKTPFDDLFSEEDAEGKHDNEEEEQEQEQELSQWRNQKLELNNIKKTQVIDSFFDAAAIKGNEGMNSNQDQYHEVVSDNKQHPHEYDNCISAAIDTIIRRDEQIKTNAVIPAPEPPSHYVATAIDARILRDKQNNADVPNIPAPAALSYNIVSPSNSSATNTNTASIGEMARMASFFHKQSRRDSTNPTSYDEDSFNSHNIHNNHDSYLSDLEGLEKSLLQEHGTTDGKVESFYRNDVLKEVATIPKTMELKNLVLEELLLITHRIDYSNWYDCDNDGNENDTVNINDGDINMVVESINSTALVRSPPQYEQPLRTNINSVLRTTPKSAVSNSSSASSAASLFSPMQPPFDNLSSYAKWCEKEENSLSRRNLMLENVDIDDSVSGITGAQLSPSSRELTIASSKYVTVIPSKELAATARQAPALLSTGKYTSNINSDVNINHTKTQETSVLSTTPTSSNIINYIQQQSHTATGANSPPKKATALNTTATMHKKSSNLSIQDIITRDAEIDKNNTKKNERNAAFILSRTTSSRSVLLQQSPNFTFPGECRMNYNDQNNDADTTTAVTISNRDIQSLLEKSNAHDSSKIRINTNIDDAATTTTVLTTPDLHQL